MKQGMIALVFVIGSVTVAMAQAPTNTQMAKGKKVYETHCLTCHQEDGTGVPRLNPPLIKTSYVTGDKKKMITWVLQGTTDKKEIDGEFYSNNMPPQNHLSDHELADVLTYIRNSFGNKAGAVTAHEVKKVRATVK